MEKANIYIYGEVTSYQEDNIEAWGAVNLKSVMQSYEAQKAAELIVVHINSPGGDVSEGFAIHDYLRSLGKPVETRIAGFCGSIATVVALAGDPDKRFMTSNSDFFIHNPWGGVGGDRTQIQKYADELQRLEVKIADFYAKKTGLTQEAALALMDGDTNLTAEQAKEYGFISEIASVMKAVALFNLDNKKEMSKKTTKGNELSEESKNLYSSIMSGVKNLLNGSKPKAKLVQAGDGVTEIDFPELEDDAEPANDDVATIDGKPAEGSYPMPNGDTYVFEAGVLTIEPFEADEEEDTTESEEMVALRAENDQLKAEAATAKANAKKEKSKLETLEAGRKADAKALKAIQAQMEEFSELVGKPFEEENRTKNFKKNSGGGSRSVFKDKKK